MAYIINMEDDLKYWLAFSRINQIGPARLIRLQKYFTNLKIAWEALPEEYLAAGLDQRTVDHLIMEKKSIDPDELLMELERHHIGVCLFSDKNYPPLLKEIYDPPAILYYRGKIINEGITLAIVGTRKISPYGTQLVKDIIPPLCQYNFITVSGLALGVDALVHQETLAVGGKTIAVLGNGLDDANLYPSSNRYLAKKIIDNGGSIISEYPPGTMPLKQHFPRRNRIISGLSQGVLIIEGDIESGSLITAAAALEQNREVMAIPGSIYSSNSAGPNELIKRGAHLIRNHHDIIEIFDLKEISQTNHSSEPTDPQQKLIWQILATEPMEIDEIIRQTGLPAATVNTQISIMELNKKIRKMTNGKIAKN